MSQQQPPYGSQPGAHQPQSYPPPPYPYPPASQPEPAWYHGTVVLVLSFLLCWPIGLVLLWLNPRASRTTKIIVSSIFGGLGALLVAGALLSSKKTSSPDDIPSGGDKKASDKPVPAGAAPAATVDPTMVPEKMLGSWEKNQTQLLVGPSTLKHQEVLLSNVKWTCRSASSCLFTAKATNQGYRAGEVTSECSGSLTLLNDGLIVESLDSGGTKKPFAPNPTDGDMKELVASNKDQILQRLCSQIAENYTRSGKTPKTDNPKSANGTEPSVEEEPTPEAPETNGSTARFPEVVAKFMALNELKQDDFAKTFKGTTLSGSGTVFEVETCGLLDDSSSWGENCIKVVLDEGAPRIALYYGKKDRSKVAQYNKDQRISFSGCVANSIKNWGLWSTATCDMP